MISRVYFFLLVAVLGSISPIRAQTVFSLSFWSENQDKEVISKTELPSVIYDGGTRIGGVMPVKFNGRDLIAKVTCYAEYDYTEIVISDPSKMAQAQSKGTRSDTVVDLETVFKWGEAIPVLKVDTKVKSAFDSGSSIQNNETTLYFSIKLVSGELPKKEEENPILAVEKLSVFDDKMLSEVERKVVYEDRTVKAVLYNNTDFVIKSITCKITQPKSEETGEEITRFYTRSCTIAPREDGICDFETLMPFDVEDEKLLVEVVKIEGVAR